MALERVWIVADTPRSIPGGMRRHMESHATGLRRHGIAARCFFSEDAFSTHIPGMDPRLPGMRLLAPLASELRRNAPDVLNVHTLCAPAWIAARAMGLFQSRIVIMSYAADERALPSTPGSPRAWLHHVRIALPQQAALPRADGIWCVNHEDAAFYRSRYRIPDEKVRVIPHALDDGFYVTPDRPREKKTILFAGTWIARKGVDVLVDALPTIIASIPDVRVIIAGVLDKAELVRAQLGALAKHVTIIPRLDDNGMRALYAEATMLLVPSRLEGLPFTLLEAMGSGCPALCAGNSGMLDVIREGENGWLLHTHDAGAWAKRVVELLLDEGALHRASQGARRDAEQFRLDVLTRRAIAWYGELTSSVGTVATSVDHATRGAI